MARLLKRHPLASFFALAFLGSWVIWSPWWLSQNGIGLFAVELSFTEVAGINQLGLFAGPFAAALIVVRVTEGKAGIKQFWRRFLQWRVRSWWWVLALVLIPLAAGSGYLLVSGFSFTPETGGFALIGLLATTYLVYLLGGPLQEEPGWRGFALPRLQQRLHPSVAALVLGLIHCLWHAPLFLTDEWDTARQDPSQYVAYLVLIVSMSFVMSWLANGSKGSILLVILGHNGVNWALFAADTLAGEEYASNWPAALGLAALAILAIVVSRGRLAHLPE